MYWRSGPSADRRVSWLNPLVVPLQLVRIPCPLKWTRKIAQFKNLDGIVPFSKYHHIPFWELVGASISNRAMIILDGKPRIMKFRTQADVRVFSTPLPISTLEVVCLPAKLYCPVNVRTGPQWAPKGSVLSFAAVARVFAVLTDRNGGTHPLTSWIGLGFNNCRPHPGE